MQPLPRSLAARTVSSLGRKKHSNGADRGQRKTWNVRAGQRALAERGRTHGLKTCVLWCCSMCVLCGKTARESDSHGHIQEGEETGVDTGERTTVRQAGKKEGQRAEEQNSIIMYSCQKMTAGGDVSA